MWPSASRLIACSISALARMTASDSLPALSPASLALGHATALVATCLASGISTLTFVGGAGAGVGVGVGGVAPGTARGRRIIHSPKVGHSIEVPLLHACSNRPDTC